MSQYLLSLVNGCLIHLGSGPSNIAYNVGQVEEQVGMEHATNIIVEWLTDRMSPKPDSLL